MQALSDTIDDIQLVANTTFTKGHVCFLQEDSYDPDQDSQLR